MFKSVKQTRMLLLLVKAKMLCLKANLIRAEALLPKAALLDWCAPGLTVYPEHLNIIRAKKNFTYHKTVVSHDVTLQDCSILGEERSYLRSFGVVSKISYEYLGGRSLGSLATRCSLHFDGLVVHHVAVQVLYGISAGLFMFHVLQQNNYVSSPYYRI